MPTEKELDQLLIGQKNDILQYIDNGEFEKAQSVLWVVCNLWSACHYGYKYNELCERIRSRLTEGGFSV